MQTSPVNVLVLAFLIAAHVLPAQAAETQWYVVGYRCRHVQRDFPTDVHPLTIETNFPGCVFMGELSDRGWLALDCRESELKRYIFYANSYRSCLGSLRVWEAVEMSEPRGEDFVNRLIASQK
jgi:hypothetical protein